MAKQLDGLDSELRLEILKAAFDAAVALEDAAITARQEASKVVNDAWLKYRAACGEHLGVSKL